MGIKLAYKLFFLIVVPCLILIAVSSIVIIGWRDRSTAQVEPQVIGDFPLRQDWWVQLDTTVDLPLASWEDIVFVRTLKSLYALSGENGTIIWQLNDLGWPDQDVIFAQDGLVIAPEDKQTILVVNAQTGKTILSLPDPIEYDSIQSAAIDGQSLYLVQDNYLFVYDLDNGTVRWDGFTGTGLDVFSIPQTSEFFLVGSQDVKIFNRLTGDLLQNTRFIEDLERYPYPNVYNPLRHELLLVRGENLYIFDLSTQSVRSTLRVGKLAFYPRLIGDKLYLANSAGEISAIDVSVVEKLWTLQIPDAKLLQTPSILGEFLYTKDERSGRVYAVSLSTQEVTGYLQLGQRHLETHFPEGINPIVATGRLIITQGDRVYGYAP